MQMSVVAWLTFVAAAVLEVGGLVIQFGAGCKW
jgi:hypothetical protein